MSLTLGTAAQGVAVFFAGLLSLAILHKARVVASGSSRAEPLMSGRSLYRAHASAVLTTAAGIELLDAVLLVARPGAGYALLGALAATYAYELGRLPADAECNCFGSLLRESRSTSIRRNAGIGLVSCLAVGGYASGVVSNTALSESSLGVGLVLAAAAAAYAALRFTNGSAAETLHTFDNQREGA